MSDEETELKISMLEAYARSMLQIATELRKGSGAATSGSPSQKKLPVEAQAKIRSKLRAKIVRKATIK